MWFNWLATKYRSLLPDFLVTVLIALAVTGTSSFFGQPALQVQIQEASLGDMYMLSVEMKVGDQPIKGLEADLEFAHETQLVSLHTSGQLIQAEWKTLRELIVNASDSVLFRPGDSIMMTFMSIHPNRLASWHAKTSVDIVAEEARTAPIYYYMAVMAALLSMLYTVRIWMRWKREFHEDTDARVLGERRRG